MVWFHALQRKAVHASTCEIDRTTRGEKVAFDLAPRPECVEHLAPGLLRVGAVGRGSVLTSHKARCQLCDFDIDDALRAS